MTETRTTGFCSNKGARRADATARRAGDVCGSANRESVRRKWFHGCAGPAINDGFLATV